MTGVYSSGPQGDSFERRAQVDAGPRSDEAWAVLYRRLHAACLTAGAFQSTTVLYAVRLALTFGALATAAVVLMLEPAWPLRLAMIALASFCGVQCGMLSHDAGHGQIARRWRVNAMVGHACDTIAIGYAFNHWRHRHDEHHAHPNDALSDPDIRTPYFALAPEQPRHPWARWLVPHQGWLMWIVFALYAFLIRVRTTMFVCTDPRATAADRLGLLVHATLWLVLPLVWLPAGTVLANYGLWTLGLGVYFSGSFIWNHMGARVVLPGERLSPFEQRLSCSRSLRGGAGMTLLFGGLNLHAEHHLFPQVPAGRLWLVRRELARLSEQEGLGWAPVGLGQALVEVQGWLTKLSGSTGAPEVTSRR